jgi:Na+/melibiose symporter-like transporter
MVMAGFFALFFALPFVATFFAARERKEFQKPPQPFDWKQTFIAPFKIRTFVFILFMYLFAFVAFDAVSSIVVYFLKNYLYRPDEISFVIGALTIAQVVTLPFFVWISRRTSKQRAFMIAGTLFMVTMGTSLLITPGAPDFAVYVFAAVAGLGSGGVVITTYAMIPDIPDVDELISGERREGVYSAMITFARKLSSAFAVFMVAQLLSLAGYLPPVMETTAGVSNLVEQTQTQGFILALRTMFFLIPVVFMTIAVVFAWRYPLDQQTHNRLNKLLTARRTGESETPEDQAEVDELKELLIG